MADSSESQVHLDARSLRALAHPLRMRLLGRLREGGPSTATALAAELGESSGVTSYHLRQLAAYGFIVEDETPRANWRERWWRAAHRVTVLEPFDAPDVETTILVDEYLRGIAGAYADRLLRFAEGLPGLRESLGNAWAATADFSDWGVVVTVDQAAELGRQIHTLIDALPQADPAHPLADGTERVLVQLQVMPTATRSAG